VRIDTLSQKIEFIPIRNQRKIFYEEFEKKEEAEEFIMSVLQESHTLKPIIKIKSPFPLDDIKSRFQGEAIILASQDRPPSFTIEEQKLSVQQSGQALLEKNLNKMGLDPKLFVDIFELLLNKKQGDALSLLKSRHKN